MKKIEGIKVLLGIKRKDIKITHLEETKGVITAMIESNLKKVRCPECKILQIVFMMY